MDTLKDRPTSRDFLPGGPPKTGNVGRLGQTDAYDAAADDASRSKAEFDNERRKQMQENAAGTRNDLLLEAALGAAGAIKRVKGAVDEAKAPPCPRGGPYGHLEDPPNVGPGKPFTRSQKAKILAENAAKNGGVLTDDKTGEPLVPSEKSQRGKTPAANEAQVDHVYPRSEGGPNSYPNAEVRGRAGNRAKGNKIPE